MRLVFSGAAGCVVVDVVFTVKPFDLAASRGTVYSRSLHATDAW